MAVISTSNHPRAHWPGVKAWWGTTYNNHPKEYPDLVSIEGSDKNYELDVQMTGMGLAPIKPQGDSTKYVGSGQGYETKYTHAAISLGFIVTYEEMRDNLYPVVAKRHAISNAFSMQQSKEIIHANLYNRAFNSEYPTGDGKEILATNHPSDAGDWANELSEPADLSEDAIQDLLIMIMTATDNEGNPRALMPQTLLVHPSNWFNANRILKSTLQNDTANNAVNVLKLVNSIPGGIKMNHYFTDTDAWFIRTNAPRGMIGYQRDSYSLKKDNEFDTDNAKAKSYDRFSCGCTDPRGLYGSAGA